MDNICVHNSRLFQCGTLVDLLLLQTATGDADALLIKNCYKLLQIATKALQRVTVTEVVTQSLH